MSSQKLIAVLGATGNQGGSVAHTFLKESGWRVRAITRNSQSAKARNLASAGAEVVEADMDDPSTLGPAFEGATAIFAVSDFWGIYADPANKDKPSPGQPLNAWTADKETQQLKTVIDAAAKVTSLERFILSSLSNATKWSKGKYTHVYHFDSKAKAADYARDHHPSLWAKTSVYQAGLFLQNLFENPITKPRVTPDGTVQFIGNLDPDVKLPWIAPEFDSGPLVKALIEGEPGKNLIGYREWLTMRETAQIFTSSTGIPSTVVKLPKGQFAHPLPEDLALEMEDNWAYFNEFGYEGRDDPTVVHPKDLEHPPALGDVAGYIAKKDVSNLLVPNSGA